MKIPYPYQNLKLIEETFRHWRFLCPFHNEKEGSFLVNKSNPYKLFYKCFGCGEYGSGMKFAKRFNMIVAPIQLINSQIDVSIKKISHAEWQSKMPTSIGWGREDPQAVSLAQRVGISPEAISKFYIGFSGETGKYYFPMYNQLEICGIQERWYEGEKCIKRCQRYSKHGQFLPMPAYFTNPEQVFICEGWSDTAVMVDMGFYAVGRFNALDCSFPLWHPDKPTYIVSDSDEVGIKGSRKLQKLIGGKVIIPQTTRGVTQHYYKDLREMYLIEGRVGTKEWILKEL